MAVDILTQGFITFFDYTHVAHYFPLFTSVSSHFESKYKNMLFEVQIEVRSFMMCDHFLDKNRFIRSFLGACYGLARRCPHHFLPASSSSDSPPSPPACGPERPMPLWSLRHRTKALFKVGSNMPHLPIF